MKKIRIVLVALSALYVLLTIIFLLNDESLFNRFNLLKLIDYLQAWIIVGLVLLIGVIVAGSLYIRGLKSQHKKLEKDYNAVKARLYDIEEERKTEISQRQLEEEQTERKFEAFNQSLKGKNKRGEEKAFNEPEETETDLDRPGFDNRPGYNEPGFEDPEDRRPPSGDEGTRV